METVSSYGQIFTSGEAIEVVRTGESDRRLQLLYWDGKVGKITTRLKLNGKIYVPPDINPTLLGAVRLPNYPLAYDSATSLAADLTTDIQKYSGLSDHFSRVSAFYAVMTCLSDLLPTAPRLSLVGPSSRGADQLIRLLGCFCRHALRLTSVAPAPLLALPFDFGFTIMIRQIKVSARLKEVLDAATMPGDFVPSNGQFLKPFSPVVLHTEKPLGKSSAAVEIEIPLLPVRDDLALLDAETEAKFAMQFQNQLLAFRLENFEMVRKNLFDPAELSFPTREVARTIGGCFPNDPALQEEVVALFRVADTHSRVHRSVSIESLLIESLLFRCHESQGDPNAGVYAGDLAGDIRVISTGRSDPIIRSLRAVGDLLRTLGFEPERLDRNGRGILLCQAIIDRVHELAARFQVPSLMQSTHGCARCTHVRQTLVGPGDRI